MKLCIDVEHAAMHAPKIVGNIIWVQGLHKLCPVTILTAITGSVGQHLCLCHMAFLHHKQCLASPVVSSSMYQSCSVVQLAPLSQPKSLHQLHQQAWHMHSYIRACH